MKTGPFKPAPHIPQGYYIAAEDRAKWVRALAAADLIDLATEIALSQELPSAEEETIKARMNLKLKVPDFPSGADIEARDNTELLRLAGLTHG